MLRRFWIVVDYSSCPFDWNYGRRRQSRTLHLQHVFLSRHSRSNKRLVESKLWLKQLHFYLPETKAKSPNTLIIFIFSSVMDSSNSPLIKRFFNAFWLILFNANYKRSSSLFLTLVDLIIFLNTKNDMTGNLLVFCSWGHKLVSDFQHL